MGLIQYVGFTKLYPHRVGGLQHPDCKEEKAKKKKKRIKYKDVEYLEKRRLKLMAQESLLINFVKWLSNILYSVPAQWYKPLMWLFKDPSGKKAGTEPEILVWGGQVVMLIY